MGTVMASKSMIELRRFSIDLLALILVPLSLATNASGQFYETTVVGTDFDIITDADPSCLDTLGFVRLDDHVEMPDKTRGGLFRPAYVFKARYRDATEVTFYVDAKFEDQNQARREVDRYAERLGKLPTALRCGVDRVVIHRSSQNTTAFSDRGLIVLYSGNATRRIADHDLEETLFHESVHAAWDHRHAKSELWIRAQNADQRFISLYAASKPALEDLAESALLAYAVIHHPDRLPKADLKKIKQTIPNRIRFLERLLPPGKPLIAVQSSTAACD